MSNSGLINGVNPYGRGTYQVPAHSYFNAVLDLQDEKAAGTEPVDLGSAKLFARITTSEEDILIGSLISAARVSVEKYLNVCCIQREFTVVLNNSLGGIFFPYGPFTQAQIDGMVLKDAQGNVIDPSNVIISGVQWPQLISPCYDRITATYTSGYLAASFIPQQIITAIKMQVTYMYRNRGDFDPVSRSGFAVVQGLSPYAVAEIRQLRRSI